MNESKFNALIHLLDDTDPTVAEQVESELYAMGRQGIGRLETAWETTTDELIQRRIEEVINRIQNDHFTKKIYEWRLGGGEDLLEGWLLLNQMAFPGIDVDKYRNEVKRQTNKIWLEFLPHMSEIDRLQVVRRALYEKNRFNGAFDDPGRPDNYFLHNLIDTGKGNPLALASLFYIICARLDMPLQIVNFNGYYAIRYYRRDQHMYIDAYNKGMFFSPDQVQEFLKKIKTDVNLMHYKPLSNIYVLLNMITGLEQAWNQLDEPEKAGKYARLLRDIDIQL